MAINEADFQREWGVSHCSVEPRTLQEVLEWLDDTASVPEAEAYRHIDRSVMYDVLADLADRVFLDIRSDYFTASESLYRHQLKDLGGRAMIGVMIAEDDSRTVLESTSLQELVPVS